MYIKKIGRMKDGSCKLCVFVSCCCCPGTEGIGEGRARKEEQGRQGAPVGSAGEERVRRRSGGRRG